jgi:hypothetical protein
VLHRCEGASLKAAVCDDDQVCTGKTRVAPAEYAGQQCAKFSQHVPFIDAKGAGMQAAYSESNFKNINSIRSWIDLQLILYTFYQNGHGNRAPFSASEAIGKDFTLHDWI